MTKYVLAIDHGTSGMKTALISTRGELIGWEAEKTPIQFLPGGGAEQDPRDWWRALVTAARRLLGRGLVPVESIAAVGVSSTFSSTVAVGPDGRALGNSLTWMDSRGAPYVKAIAGGFPSVEGYNLLMMLPWIYKTGGGPQLSGKDDIAHVLWWQHARPEIYRDAQVFLGSKDYLNLRLTGRIAASYDSIMLFWVTNTRDINRVHYDDWLIKKVGIDRAKLPPLKRAIDVLGPLSAEAAAELGLPATVPVVMGSPDHQSACIGSGAVRDYEGHLYIGTSSWIQCVVPFKKTDPLHSIASLPTAIPGRYYCVNEQDLAGGCLSFLADNLLCRPNALRPDGPPPNVYALMDEIAAAVPAGSGGVIFTPWLNGERTPVDDPNLRGGFHNLSLTTTSDHLVRAVLEGVALNNRWALGYVDKFIGRRMERINIIGGGAKSALWCQIFADVFNRPIRQVQDPIQANARGAAFIAAVALGEIGFADVPDLVPIAATYTPNPANRKIYDRLFQEFVALYRANRKIYRRLNRGEVRCKEA
jgi:xylulokinase